jgi:hypothetical protein
VYFLVNKKEFKGKCHLACGISVLIADGMVLHGEKDEMPHAWLGWKDFEQVAFLGS